jgi:DNA-binding NarL/FixJ family response regulator
MFGTRPRILIAEDHLFLAELCKKLLDGEFDVIDIVTYGRAMVREATRLHPDVILVDVGMPTLNGLDAGRQVKRILPSTKLLYLSMKNDPEIVAEVFRFGASGYMLKTCTSSQLVVAVRTILRGRTYMSPTLPREHIGYLRRQDSQSAQDATRLTERQREILQLIAEGKCMKEVGAVLNVTIRTVAFHKYRMMERLGARSTADLVRFAVENHMVAG